MLHEEIENHVCYEKHLEIEVCLSKEGQFVGLHLREEGRKISIEEGRNKAE